MKSTNSCSCCECHFFFNLKAQGGYGYDGLLWISIATAPLRKLRLVIASFSYSLVETLQAKLDYTLNYRGMNLSAGEKQLICLARVLLQESKIVILDKPTAHVDPKTEQIIHETIREKMKNSTVITMTHRL